MLYTVVLSGVRHFMAELTLSAKSAEEAEALATHQVATRAVLSWQNSDGQTERTFVDGVEILEVREGLPPRHPERIIETEAG